VKSNQLSTVMPALVAGIYGFSLLSQQDVDGRDKPGHDCGVVLRHGRNARWE
jgi:hypothetical protein